MVPDDVVKPFHSVKNCPNEEHEVDKQCHLPGHQHVGQEPHYVHGFLVGHDHGHDRVFVSESHKPLQHGAQIGYQEDLESWQLATQWVANHVQEVAEALEVAQTFRHGSLLLVQLVKREY